MKSASTKITRNFWWLGFIPLKKTPYGVVTYTTPDGIQLNGQLGLMINGGYSITESYTLPYPPYTTTKSTISVGGGSTLQLNVSAAKDLGKGITGMAELGLNGQGYGRTPLVAGIRGGNDILWTLFAGLDLGTPVGVMIGGNVALISQ